MTDASPTETSSPEPGADQASKPRIPESVRRRSQNRTSGAPAPSGGPSPGRILAAAGSVSLGVGLIAVLAGTGQNDVIIEVNPTPVIVQPAPVVTEVAEDGSTELLSTTKQDLIVIAGAAPADANVDATPVARSEGS